jgi:3D-(3,5/4)-trihydroxycyclohexane-1,2-dione acylhydrolase (decyclizing)
MSRTIRLTMAQALVRYLAALCVDDETAETRLFGGVFAIFGHGNVAGLGEALYAHRDVLPTYRAHNEQAMAHAAIAFAKAHMRRRMMACTTSIGPGATNLVTAAALAHVNRLPVLLLPGDIFITRAPDPVLQQVEDFHDGTVSANDCLKPVSRYFDRIAHPAQLLSALPRAIRVLTDPATCGPVTLAMPQDVQAMAHDYPADFFAPPPVRFAAPPPIANELEAAVALLRQSKHPLIIAGGGVLYAHASGALKSFADVHGIPVTETQAGKGALPWDDPMQQGAIGVTGSPAANALAQDADVVIAVGTRLSDFTTGSHSMFGAAQLLSVNVARFDAQKWRGLPVCADAGARSASGPTARKMRATHGAARLRGSPVNATSRCRTKATSSAPYSARPPIQRRATSSSAPPGRFPLNCTSSGAHRHPAATTWSTGIRAWATRLPAPSASRWRIPSARSSFWSATAAI